MTSRLDDVIVPLAGDLEASYREAVLGLFEAVFGEASGHGRRNTYDWQFHAGGMGTRSRLLIYWQAGRPAGTAGLFDTTLFVDGVPYPAAFFTDLAVSSACRGRGIGARLTRSAREAGQRVTIGLGTNPASNRIMKKQGFVEVGGVKPMFRLLRLEGFVRRRLRSADSVLNRWGLRVVRAGDAAANRFLTDAYGRLWRGCGVGGGQREPGVSHWVRRLRYPGGMRASTCVRAVDRFPAELDGLMQAFPHFWPVTPAQDHAALNRRYRGHPYHRYRLEMAWRGRAPVGAAVWRVFGEPPGVTMGHLSALYFLPGEDDVADALVSSGIAWLLDQGAYLVKALASHPLVRRCLRRHLFFARGASPGLLFHTESPELRRRLVEQPWLVHLGTSDLDVR